MRRKINILVKLENLINDIKLNEVISTIIGLSFFYLSFIYPVWLIPGSFLFDFLTFLSLWILNIILVYITSSFIKKYEKEIRSILKDLKAYLKISAKILIPLFFILIIIFFEYIFFTPLQSRGDEPAHISRIINYVSLWTLNALIPNQISFLMIITILVFICYLFFQISKIPRKILIIKKKILKKVDLLLIIGPIFIIFIFLMLANNLNVLNLNFLAFARYGPIHPSIYSIPVFLLGWNYTIIPVWRIMNIITSLFTLFLCSYIINLSFQFRKNRSEHSNIQKISNIRLVLSYLLVILLFFNPAVMLFTFSVWLTTGVVFFSCLSFLFILYYLIESSKKKKRVLLFFNAIIFGYCILWKEDLLLQPIIFIIFVILRNIPHIYKKALEKRSIINFIKTGFSFFLLISIIGMPFQFLSILLAPRPLLLRFSNIFSINYFHYFYECFLQVGFIASILYLSLIILIFFALFKKEYYLLLLPFAFFMWFTYFYVMIFVITPITMVSTRVMNIPILILILSFAILISKIHIPRIFHQQKKIKELDNFIRMSIIIAILIPYCINGYSYAEYTRKGLMTNFVSQRSLRLPYDEVANYIITRWDNNTEKVYYYYGPNSLRLYFYLEGFHLQFRGNFEAILSKEEELTLTLPIFWETDKKFSSVDEFLNYSIQNNIRFIALPEKKQCYDHLRPILDQLITLGVNGTIEMVQFTYYESSYYVWDLRSYV